jgi:hypothetical protein
LNYYLTMPKRGNAKSQRERLLARTPSEITREPIPLLAEEAAETSDEDMSIEGSASGVLPAENVTQVDSGSENVTKKHKVDDNLSPGASAGAASSAAPADANLVDMMQQLLNNFQGLRTDVNASVAALDFKFDAKIAAMQKTIDDQQRSVDARFATMDPVHRTDPWTRARAAGAAGAASTSLARAADAASASASAAAAPAAPAVRVPAAAAAPAASSSAAAVGKGDRLWVKGFVTTQTHMLMAVSAREYLAKLPPVLAAEGRVQANGFGVAISLVFSSKALTDQAFTILRDLRVPFVDPSSGETVPLRITRDLPLHARSRNRVTGILWGHVNKHMETTNESDFKVAQSNGRLYVLIKGSPVELFQIKTVKEGETSRLEATANFANLLRFGISRAVATVWSDEASGAQLG